MSAIEDFKSVVLTSADPDRTAAFYRDALGLPLARERHRGTAHHWAGMVGGQHLAIHPTAGSGCPARPATPW